MRFIKGPIRWGIVGCGDVCEVKSGPALQKIPGSSLVAVMRRDPDKARDFADRHQVGTYYSNATELINDPAVNAVYVATPPSTHEAYAMAAMQAGKPVYIEKPVSTDSASCMRLIDEAKNTDVPVSVAHYRRGLAIFRRVKDLINEGAIGDCKLALLELFQASNPALRTSSENWRIDPNVSGGGLLFDLAPHQLDIIYWLFGAPVTVKGLALNQGKHYSAPDVHTLTAVFRNNLLFQGLWSFDSPAHACRDQLTIIGTGGSLTFPFFSSFADTKLRIKTSDGELVEEFLFPQHIQQPLIEEVVTFFQGKGHNPCSLNEALVSLMMIEQAASANPD